MKGFFMHIKGPEILNMWVGESERMVREKRREGYLPFIFIDEAESILGTRRGGRFSSILSTLVPMFCTEMDGLESLHDAVIIIASIVERAKAHAIRRALATGKDEGISESDLLVSLEAEYQENDIFPPTDITEDWLHLIDHDAENVVKVSPIRASENGAKAGPSVI